nr:transcription repressor OFP13 [Ipomoea batatas]
MTKKMKLPSIFKTKADQMNAWQWPSCAHAKTLSFRADAGAGAGIFKTVNSVYLDPAAVDDGVDTPESCFTNTSESASFSTGESDDERIIVTGVRKSRGRSAVRGERGDGDGFRRPVRGFQEIHGGNGGEPGDERLGIVAGASGLEDIFRFDALGPHHVRES